MVRALRGFEVRGFGYLVVPADGKLNGLNACSRARSLAMTEHLHGVVRFARECGLNLAAAATALSLMLLAATFSQAVPAAAENTPHDGPRPPGVDGSGPRLPPGGAPQLREDEPGAREEQPQNAPAAPDEKGSGEPYGGGCPYRGRRLELIV